MVTQCLTKVQQESNINICQSNLLKYSWGYYNSACRQKCQVCKTERRYDLLKRVYASMRDMNHYNDTSTVSINSLNVAVLYSCEHWMARLTRICCQAFILVEFVYKIPINRIVIGKWYLHWYTSIYDWLITTRPLLISTSIFLLPILSFSTPLFISLPNLYIYIYIYMPLSI